MDTQVDGPRRQGDFIGFVGHRLELQARDQDSLPGGATDQQIEVGPVIEKDDACLLMLAGRIELEPGGRGEVHVLESPPDEGRRTVARTQGQGGSLQSEEAGTCLD